ncbi:MAG: hypothetical protein R3E10_07740 [Gemmatimonadota bacterium]
MVARLLRSLRWIPAIPLALALAACTDGTTPDVIAFDVPALTLGPSLTGSLSVRNAGPRAVGPIELRSGPVSAGGATDVPGAHLVVDPPELSTLPAGASAVLQVRIESGTLLQAGTYATELVAAIPGAETRLPVSFTMPAVTGVEAAAVQITSGPTTVRQGDVTPYRAEARDTAGAPLQGAAITWSVTPQDAGFVAPSGALVAYQPGTLTLRAHVGGLTARLDVTVSARGLGGDAVRVGEGAVLERHTSDLWLHGSYAYTGTWGARTRNGVSLWGDALNVWDLSTPTSPVRVDAVSIEARTLNDVKVRSDGALAVITHEGDNAGRNGVTFLDLADPAHPAVLSRFTQGLESGVHNAWLDGDYAYLVVDGVGNGLRILDIRDPRAPRLAASFYGGSSFLHDVYVRDGLAFLSHWNAGLIILDVGNGVAGGSPTNPVEVSRVPDLGGQTHNAWYWPESGYVFVGEEDFQSPGHMHVVDLHDLSNPVEVASFRVPGTTPHNFWLDEERGVLYLAWYERGLHALDVSGPLLGDLRAQGREVFGVEYDGQGFGCATVDGTCTWAPQLHGGLLYVSDMNNGLVVLRPTF